MEALERYNYGGKPGTAVGKKKRKLAEIILAKKAEKRKKKGKNSK